MKHLNNISQSKQLPALAIEIPQDVILRVQEIDFLQFALNLLPAASAALKAKSDTTV